MIVGVVRTTPVNWLRRLGDAWVEVFRNVPLLVQMFIWFFVVPELLPTAVGTWLKQLPRSAFYTAVVCLGLYTSARVAEQVRAGIQSLASGQRMAGVAIGLTLPQTYRYILLPMAIRIVMPPLTSEFLNVIKNSARGADDRAGRAHGQRSLDAGVQLPGLRGVHGGHPHLPGAEPRRGARHALARAEAGGAGAHRCGRGHAAGRALSVLTGFDWDVIRRAAPYLFREGMTFTLTLTALAMTGGIVFGTLLAMMRLASYRALSSVAGAYVNVMRSTPLVLVIFWFYFLVPWIGGWLLGASRPIQVGAFVSSLVTFMMFEAAYYCEIMRAGIQSIPRGQMWAGYALGLSYWQTMGRIVLPQAFRNMVPVLLTQTIILFQDTSLVYVISITDFLGAASKIAQRDGRLVEMYLFVAVVYFAISFGLSSLVKRLQAQIAVPSR